MPFTDAEIHQGIFQQYSAKLPRPGPEHDAFVADQCAYFGITEKLCKKIMGYAQQAKEAESRVDMRTRGQAIADAMGGLEAEVVQTMRSGMRATKKRPIVSGGVALKDEKGEFVYYEVPDWSARNTAALNMARILGMEAPKNIHVEGKFELNTTISDDALFDEYRRVGQRFGATILLGQATGLIPGGPGSDVAGSAEKPAGGSGEGPVLVADHDDGDD